MITVLVVEDDIAIQQLLTEMLTKEGYQVISAYSGTEGKLVIEQKKVDVILLDLMLPGMSGKEFLTAVRQRSKVPVIVLSARREVAERIDLLQNGADDYLVKPFDIQELAVRISVQLRHKSDYFDLQQLLNFQEISVDLETREVKVAGQSIELTVKEYQILILLLAHPHKIFSRKNIYEAVWEEPYFDNEKTINVHVSNLRAKLNNFGSEYIKTIWGIGFRLDVKSS